MGKNKKTTTIDSMVGYQDLDKAEVIDEKSTLCIKNGIATNYRYNKERPQHPYCISNLSCVYRNKVGEKNYCEYMHKKYEVENNA